MAFQVDDGLRVRVNHQLVIDNRQVQVADLTTVAALGKDTRFQIEWFENGGGQALSQPSGGNPPTPTLPLRTSQTTRPSNRGSSGGRGGPRSPTADDDAHFEVNSTGPELPTTAWIGEILRVPNSLRDLTVTYVGAHSRVCTQRVAIRDWVSGSWVTSQQRAGLGPNEVAIADLVPPGEASRFVRGRGRLWQMSTCA